jgi:hypothetical protein
MAIRLKLLSLGILLMLISGACRDDYSICDQSREVNFKAGFYNKNGAIDVPVTPVSLTMTFPGVSTYIYFQAAGISLLNLALNPGADSVKYFIQVQNNLPADTVTLVYTSRIQNLSPECGDVTIHRFIRAWSTTNTVDSIKITNPDVNTTSPQNLRIYY